MLAMCLLMCIALTVGYGCAMAETCAHTSFRETSTSTSLPVGEKWTDNGDGTHSANGETWTNCYCYDCGSWYETDYQSGLLTRKHSYSSSTGKCWDCGAACPHEKYTINKDQYNLADGEEWKADSNGTTHSAVCDQYDEYWCEKCGYSWKKNLVTGTLSKKHDFYKGECQTCDYACPHERVQEYKDNYRLVDGEEWKADSNGTTHSALCEQYDGYSCKVCYYYWKENLVTKTITKEHGFNSETGECYTCGYVCPHKSVSEPDHHFLLLDGESWKDDKNGLTHTGKCESYDYSYCKLCYKSWKDNYVVKNRTEYHYGTNKCEDCGTYNIIDRGYHWFVDEDPKNVIAAVGEKVKTSVTIWKTDNAPTLKYQWYYKNPGSSTFKKSSLTGKTYSTTMTAAMNGRQIYCEITDPYGVTETTKVAYIMLPELAITKQPADATVSAGETATFTVKATGSGLKYQWYYRNEGATQWKKASGTKASYSTKSTVERNGRQFYCEIKDSNGEYVKSKIVTMRLPALKITTQPKNAKAYEGEKAKISVKATGDGLTYQWYYSTDGGTTYKKASGTKASYSLEMTKARNGRLMYCVVKDAYGVEKKTNVVKLTTKFKAAITAQPKNAKAFDGEKATTTIKAAGDGLTYQWYYKNPGSDSFKKSSITTAKCSVTMNADRDGRKMYCVVTDKYGNKVKSETVTLSLKKTVKITKEPKSCTKAVGEKAKFTVKATGDGLTYQWQYKSADSSTWKNASSTSSSYSPTVKASHDGRKFRCVVTDKYGNTVKTKTVKLTVK